MSYLILWMSIAISFTIHVIPTLAQCTDPEFDFTSSGNKSACQLARTVLKSCNDSIPYNDINPYPHLDSTSTCYCLNAMYSLASACAGCGEQGIKKISEWWDCSEVSLTEFSNLKRLDQITLDALPPWTKFTYGSFEDKFDPQSVKNQSDPLDSPALVPTSSTVLESVIPPYTFIVADTEAVENTNIGAIAGGVVSGVVALALIICVVIWLVMRRRRSQRPPSAEYLATYGEVHPHHLVHRSVSNGTGT